MFLKSRVVTLFFIIFVLSDYARLIIPGFDSIYDYVVVGIVIFLVIKMLVLRNQNMCIKNKMFYYAIIMFWMVIMLIEIYHSSFQNYIILCEQTCWILLPMCLMLSNNGKKEFHIVLAVFIILNMIISIPSVLNHFIDLPGSTLPGIMFINDGGYYGNRNVNAMINITSAVLCLYLLINSNNRLKYICIIPLLFNLICVLFSGSRTSIICLIIIIFIYILNSVKSVKLSIMISLITIIVGIFVVFYRILGDINTTVEFEEFLNNISSNRYYIWREALIISKDNLLLGSGVNTLSKNAINYFGDSSVLAIYYGTITNCHNLFINILYNSGLIAFLYFVGLCIYYVKIIFKTPITLQRLSSLMVVLCGFLIAMLDVPLLYTTSVINIIWWLFVFYTVSEA